jgi:hypothetical protein
LTEAEDKAPPEDDDQVKRKFWFRALTDASRELRPQLRMDEAGYLFVSAGAHAHPRDYFLYGVLDELQKAALAILRWSELFEGPELKAQTDDDRQTHRVLYGSVADEEALWTRKLTEALIDLICFGATNEESYYRHYLLLGRLRERKSTAADLETFYACPSRNLQSGVGYTARQIAELERAGEVDLARCWYVDRSKPLAAEDLAVQRVTQLVSSTRRRLRTALDQAGAGEQIALGLSYDRSFGQASRDMHFGARGLRLPPDEHEISSGLDQVGVLGLHVIHRVQLLSDLVPGKANQFVKDVVEDDTESQRLLARHSDAGVEEGDFVLAYEDPGQVLESRVSPLGYRSYRVLYLAGRPLETVEDDWIPAQHVRLMMRQADLLSAKAGDESPSLAEALASLRELPHAEQSELLRAGFKDVWEGGLRDWIRPTGSAARTRAATRRQGGPDPPALPPGHATPRDGAYLAK